MMILGRYKKLGDLGSGGCGETYLAEDTGMPSKRRCAVKRLKPLTNDPDEQKIIKEMFAKEAEVLERLGRTYEQIPELYEYREEAGEFYIVQEFVEGQTLSRKIKDNGPLEWGDVIDIVVNLLLLLRQLHSEGIIHRDIKPSNIILSQPDEYPMLIDFGSVKEIITTIVKPYGGPATKGINSYGYSPPEVIAGRPEFSSDLYSVGMTAIFLLTGKHPATLFDPKDGALRWYNPIGHPKHPLSQAIYKSTATSPSQRYANAGEMLRELRKRFEWYTPYMFAAFVGPASLEISAFLSVKEKAEIFLKNYRGAFVNDDLIGDKWLERFLSRDYPTPA